MVNRMEEHMYARQCTVLIYRILEDPIDKFILMAIMEGGYSQEEVARMFGVSQESVCKRLSSTKQLLRIKQREITG